MKGIYNRHVGGKARMDMCVERKGKRLGNVWVRDKDGDRETRSIRWGENRGREYWKRQVKLGTSIA